MSIQARLIAVLGMLLLLAAAGWHIHVKADAAGYARAQAEQAQDVLAASEKRRNDERALTISNDRIAKAHDAEKNRLAAAAAATSDRLRSLQAALGAARSADAATAARLDDAARLVASECAAALTALDEHAAALAARLAGLQAYTRAMRLSPDNQD